MSARLPGRAARRGLALAVLLLAGCGKKAPLRLPDQSAEKAGGLSARVREDRVFLEFRVPARRVFPEREEPWVLARILRREGAEGQEFAEAGAILERRGFEFGAQLAWEDEGRAPGRPLAYRVEFRSEDRRRRALTETLLLAWDRVPAAPEALALSGDEGAVALSWSAPAGGTEVRYRVYRRAAGADVAEVLPPGAISQPRHVDARVSPGSEYCYAVRAVLAATGVEVEGPASAERCARSEDATPPPAPRGLKVAPAGTGLLLTWEPVAAGDLLGYHVYRGVGEGNLERLTAAPVEGTGFRDALAGIAPGTACRWAVTAVDRSPRRNESPLSEGVAAPVPPPSAP